MKMKKYTVFIAVCLILTMFTACAKNKNSQMANETTEISESIEPTKESDSVQPIELNETEAKSEVGIFENYVEDGWVEDISSLKEEDYSQYACNLKKAKELINDFYGIWTSALDNEVWWESPCDFMDKTINNMEYRVDTMYYWDEEGIKNYVLGFHFVEDEEKFYIAEMTIISPTDTEEGSEVLYDLLDPVGFVFDFLEENPQYSSCNFNYGYRFPDEQEFALAREADEAATEDIQNQQNNLDSNQGNTTQNDSWKGVEVDLYSLADKEIQSYLRKLYGDSNLWTQNRSTQTIQWMSQEMDFSGTYDVLCVTISYSSIYSKGSYFDGTYHAIIHYRDKFMYNVDSVY